MKVLKIIGYLFLILMAIVLIFGSYFGVKKYIERRDQNRNFGLITIAVSYDLDTCNVDNPLLIRISNGSDKILNSTGWDLLAKQEGYSNNVLKNKYLSYKSNKILKPNESHSMCYEMPETEVKRSAYLDLTKLSSEDLDALESGNLKAMSEEGVVSLASGGLIWEVSLNSYDTRFEEQ